MQQQNTPISTLVDTYKRGELRLPEIQRHYVWQATRVAKLQGPEALVAQVVPTSPEPLKLPNYQEFLRLRWEALAARMIPFISEAAASPQA